MSTFIFSVAGLTLLPVIPVLSHTHDTCNTPLHLLLLRRVRGNGDGQGLILIFVRNSPGQFNRSMLTYNLWQV
jgi:hypothetical protein